MRCSVRVGSRAPAVYHPGKAGGSGCPYVSLPRGRERCRPRAQYALLCVGMTVLRAGGSARSPRSEVQGVREGCTPCCALCWRQTQLKPAAPCEGRALGIGVTRAYAGITAMFVGGARQQGQQEAVCAPQGEHRSRALIKVSFGSSL